MLSHENSTENARMLLCGKRSVFFFCLSENEMRRNRRSRGLVRIGMEGGQGGDGGGTSGGERKRRGIYPPKITAVPHHLTVVAQNPTVVMLCSRDFNRCPINRSNFTSRDKQKNVPFVRVYNFSMYVTNTGQSV